MGIENTFGRLRVENDSGTIFIADINKLIVPDGWLTITGPDEATIIQGNINALTSLANITIDADTDANGSGTIALRTRNLARFTVNNDGTLTAAGKKLTLGDASVLDAARVDLKTKSTILTTLLSQTFEYVGSGPGGASYSNHSFGLFYNEAEVAGDATFALNHEPKFSQGGAPYQTEIYYTWEDPTHTFSIRPWGMVIQHATGDTRFDMFGEVNFHRNLSGGGTQTALWKESGVLEFTNGTSAQIVFPNNAPAITAYDAAVTQAFSLIKLNSLDKVSIDSGGLGSIFGGVVTGGAFDVSDLRGNGDTDTEIEFPGSNLMRFYSGGTIMLGLQNDGVRLSYHTFFETDNTWDFGTVSAANFRPRDIKAGRDIYAGGVLIIGSGPTTLTDAAGKILSAALNTVAIANGGTGSTSAAAARTALGVEIESGTSFPGSPATNGRCFRTDRGIEYYYDGTRWLSVELFTDAVPEVSNIAFPYAATALGAERLLVPYAGTYDLWLIEVQVAFFVLGGTALSASHKWVSVFQKLVAAGTATTIATVNIDSGASSVWRTSVVGINALLGITHFTFSVDHTKTGTPGNLYTVPRIVYRLVG